MHDRFPRIGSFARNVPFTDSPFPRLESAALVLFLLATAAAPLSWGAVLPAGRFRLEILAFFAALLAAAAAPARRALPQRAAIPLFLASAIGIEGALQLVPLPPPLLLALSPASAGVHREAARALAVFGDPPAAGRITIAPWETASTIVLLGAYVAIFWSAAVLLRSRGRRRSFLAAVLGAAVLEVAVGAARTPPGARVHGSFVNPDHFAAYLEIALALAFGLIRAEVLQGSERAPRLASRAERVEKRLFPLAWRVLLWGFIAGGIVLTRSRGGIAAAALATVVLLAVGRAETGRRARRTAFLPAIPAVALGVVFVAAATRGEALLRFLASDPRDIGADLRIAIWKTSLRAWREFPLLGSGLGTFREAFRSVQPRELAGLVEQAHGDLLQILVTGGGVGAALAAAALATALLLLLRLAGRQPRREESSMALAGFGALLSVALHGIVDSNLSIPAIPAVLAAALGAAWAAGSEGSETVAARLGRREETGPPDRAGLRGRSGAI